MSSTSSLPAESDPRWAAVLHRDPAADGAFVYAVTSTGVYCRPSCPSRRPRPERVAFHATPASARAAGYRACRRCAPDAAAAPTTRTATAVDRARALLDAGAAGGDDRVSLAALARRVGVSAAHLQRAFTRAFGLSPARYAAARRAERWKVALRTEGTVSRATFAAGYSAASRAYAAADAHLGMTPTAYRRGGAGVRLWWATFDTPQGRALAAVTTRGVCAVLLADAAHEDPAAADATLDAALAAEFPAADRQRIAGGDAGTEVGADVGADASVAADADAGRAESLLRGAMAAVRARAAGRVEEGVPLAVDAVGTPWQRQVWDALRAIPVGETRTYAQLAAALGRPTAARAVARACATNRVALVVPCHRVVPAGAAARGFAPDAVSGYRWGPARKASLLAAERAASDGTATAR